MKCLECGKTMKEGTVTGHGQGLEAWYEFMDDEEKQKKGLSRLFRTTVTVSNTNEVEIPAWYCPECGKILIWTDSKEQTS